MAIKMKKPIQRSFNFTHPSSSNFIPSLKRIFKSGFLIIYLPKSNIDANIKFINEGGWHFTNLKSPEEIKHKLKSYLHHREFEINPLSIEEIEKLIENKKAIYDLTIDKRVQKIGDGNKLEKYDMNKLPLYINNNLDKFKKWID